MGETFALLTTHRVAVESAAEFMFVELRVAMEIMQHENIISMWRRRNRSDKIDHNGPNVSLRCCISFVVGREKLTSSSSCIRQAIFQILMFTFEKWISKEVQLMIFCNKIFGRNYGKFEVVHMMFWS